MFLPHHIFPVQSNYHFTYISFRVFRQYKPVLYLILMIVCFASLNDLSFISFYYYVTYQIHLIKLLPFIFLILQLHTDVCCWQLIALSYFFQELLLLDLIIRNSFCRILIIININFHSICVFQLPQTNFASFQLNFKENIEYKMLL
jgi:hypothetical protein